MQTVKIGTCSTWRNKKRANNCLSVLFCKKNTLSFIRWTVKRDAFRCWQVKHSLKRIKCPYNKIGVFKFHKIPWYRVVLILPEHFRQLIFFFGIRVERNQRLNIPKVFDLHLSIFQAPFNYLKLLHLVVKKSRTGFSAIISWRHQLTCY